MKVSELIEKLRDMPQDMEVVVSYIYGDYWKTEVADDVSKVEIRQLAWSQYHDKYKTLPDDKFYDEEDGEDGDGSINSVNDFVVIR